MRMVIDMKYMSGYTAFLMENALHLHNLGKWRQQQQQQQTNQMTYNESNQEIQ